MECVYAVKQMLEHLNSLDIYDVVEIPVNNQVVSARVVVSSKYLDNITF